MTDWNEEIGKLRPTERGFVKDVVDTLTLFQANHEAPARLRLTGKYHDGMTLDMDESWPKPKATQQG